jgi:hypothetical protein
MRFRTFRKSILIFLSLLFIIVSCTPADPKTPGVTNPSWTKADLVGLTKVALEWTTVPNVDSYTLERKQGNGAYTEIFKGKATTTEDDKVAEGQSYTYRIKAVKGVASSSGVEKAVIVPSKGTPQPLANLTQAEAWFSKTATNGDPSTTTNAAPNVAKSGTNIVVTGTGEAIYYLGGTCSIFNATVSGAGFKVFADDKQLWPAAGAASSGSTGDLAVANKQSLSLVFQGTGTGTWTNPTIYCETTPAKPETTYLQGKWGAVFDWGTGTPVAGYKYGKIVPTHAANLPDGSIATWAAWKETTYGNKPDEAPNPPFLNQTAGFVWNPSNGSFITTNNPTHDMFCAGLATMANGDIFAAGGGSLGTSGGTPDSQRRTSYFDIRTKQWAEVGSSTNLPLSVNHWYGTAVALPDNRVFVIGGSDGGSTTGAEIRGPDKTSPWIHSTSNLAGMFPTATDINTPSGATVTLGNGKTANEQELGEVFGWYPYLNVAPDGQLFQSGPIPRFYKYSVGATAGADVPITPSPLQGSAPATASQMRTWGNSIMYDEGKILVTGGSVLRGAGATNTGILLDINSNVSAEAASPMRFRRAHHNTVVLPTGDILAIGGNNSGKQFTDGSGFTASKREWEAGVPNGKGSNANYQWLTDIDTESVLTAELFSPDKNTWHDIATMTVPRNYHSVAILLQDGRVLAAGGGLCGDLGGVVTGVPCNHPNGQVLEPPYLFRPDGEAATRPVIASLGAGANSNPDVAGTYDLSYGSTFNVTLANLGDSTQISKFSMIKLSAVTHSINTDVRYLEYSSEKQNLTGSGTSYQLKLTSNKNVLTPGYYFLFAINDKGVPSVAQVVQVN